MRPALSLFLVAALLDSCTWVTPSPEALSQNVAVLDTTSAARCRLMTRTKLTVPVQLGDFQRMPADVQHDLQVLAINQAASAGDNAVVALSHAVGGKQTFGLYVCGGNAGATSAPAAVTTVKTIPYNPPR